MRKITHIVFHTAAAPGDVDQTAAAIRAYHKRSKAAGGKGWSDIGYHAVIRKDGTVEPGRPENQPGAHVEGFNTPTLGVVCTGHGDLSDFTPQQKAALAVWIADKLEAYGLVDEFKANPMRVVGHREVNVLIEAGVTNAPRTSKTCPGTKVDCSSVRRSVIAELQRRKALK